MSLQANIGQAHSRHFDTFCGNLDNSAYIRDTSEIIYGSENQKY